MTFTSKDLTMAGMIAGLLMSFLYAGQKLGNMETRLASVEKTISIIAPPAVKVGETIIPLRSNLLSESSRMTATVRP